MSDNQEQDLLPVMALPAIDDTVEAEIVVPDLDIRYLTNGLPLVIANQPEIIERVRAECGFNQFYLVAHKKTVEKWEGKNIAGHGWVAAGSADHFTPKIMKVVFNTVGWSIHEAPEEDLGLAWVEQSACFTLPKIPIELIYKMDAFFRTVARELQTEAIVILTFDETVDGPDSTKGWGICVPKQENTPGHCQYDQLSIIDAKPDDAIIVGTAHSHPNMSAFASGTDHHDQADFDGIHITFGWQSTVNAGATQFHLELQMGGQNWTLKPEQIFTEAPKPPEFPEVDEWKKNVSKRQPAQTHVRKTYTPPHTPSGPTTHVPSSRIFDSGFSGTAGYGATNRGYLAAQQAYADDTKRTHPDGCPDIKKYIAIVELLEDNEAECPICTEALDSRLVENRRCPKCWNFLALPGEDIDDVMNARIAVKLDYFDIDSKRQKSKPIAFWHRKMQDNVFSTHVTVDVEGTPRATEEDDFPFVIGV